MIGFLLGTGFLYGLLWLGGGLRPKPEVVRARSEARSAPRAEPFVQAPAPRLPQGTPASPAGDAGAAHGAQLPVTDPLPSVPAADLTDVQRLIQRGLTPPLAGLTPSRLYDNFDEVRGGVRRHEALDMLAPRGTPVLAVDSGVVKKLFNSRQGGLTIYQFDREEQYCFYYAHLDRYAEGVFEGLRVERGDRIGYVGTTGNAPEDTPHLHFAIFKLGPEKRWWHGTPINPYPVLMSILK